MCWLKGQDNGPALITAIVLAVFDSCCVWFISFQRTRLSHTHKHTHAHKHGLNATPFQPEPPHSLIALGKKVDSLLWGMGVLSLCPPHPSLPPFTPPSPSPLHLPPLPFSSPPFVSQAKDSDLALLASIPLALLDSSLCWWISFGSTVSVPVLLPPACLYIGSASSLYLFYLGPASSLYSATVLGLLVASTLSILGVPPAFTLPPSALTPNLQVLLREKSRGTSSYLA